MSRISPLRGAVDAEASLSGAIAPRFASGETWAIGRVDMSVSTKRATGRVYASRRISIWWDGIYYARGRIYSLCDGPNAALVVAGSTTANAVATPIAAAISIAARTGRASPTST